MNQPPVVVLLSAIAIPLFVTSELSAEEPTKDTGLLCSTTTAFAPDSVSLVREGRPAAVIVLADSPTEAARLGAAELQSWLLKATGATLLIQPESKMSRPEGAALILIGDTKRTTDLGLRSDALDLEEIRIRTFPGALVILGDDRRPDGQKLSGTLWAVETFAEQCLGVRLLWPGPLGEVVPKRATVEVGPIDVRHVPALRKRGIRNIGYNERVQKGLDALGWNADDFKRHHQEGNAWFRFQRIGGSFNGSYGHAFTAYWERFSHDHPDWFALQPGGSRDNSRADGGHRARLCVSNRGLIEQVARHAIEALRKDPTLDTASISPNDGGRATFCQCDSCKAWDASDGQMIESWGPSGPIRHVSLTDRYVKFYSAVAEIVAKELPDRLLGAYAYSAYALPPVHAKLHPNVVIGFVGFSYLNEGARQQARASWLAWSRAARQLFLRPNLLTAGAGFPTVYVHRLAEDLRFCAANGMRFTDFDCCYQHWATDGLNYYALARLLWDPNLDVDAMIDDYCRAGFGAAAEPIRTYLRRVEDLTTEIARSNTYEGRKTDPEDLACRYTDAFLSDCDSLLSQADSKAGEDSTVRARVDFLRKAVEYARLRRDWVLAKAAARKGDKEAAKLAKTVEARCDTWYRQLGISWAINAPNLRYYGF